MASMTCGLIFAAPSHRKEESTKTKHRAAGLAGTHQPTGPPPWGSDADIPQGWGSDGAAGIAAAFAINPDAITGDDGSLGWHFSGIQSPQQGGTTGPLPGS